MKNMIQKMRSELSLLHKISYYIIFFGTHLSALLIILSVVMAVMTKSISSFDTWYSYFSFSRWFLETATSVFAVSIVGMFLSDGVIKYETNK